MAETFYLSNVVPQNSNNNAGFWYRLEAYCRVLARRYNGVYVFSGPLFLPETELDGRKFVKYQVNKTYITVFKNKKLLHIGICREIWVLFQVAVSSVSVGYIVIIF